MADVEIQEKDEVATEESAGKFVILCKKCQFHLTYSDYAISIEGHHDHVQCNPHGNTFVFRCFSRVPGALLFGESTQEHSWFSGYSWQLSHCQGCGQHLGWYFRNKEKDTFFGLIADKIISQEQEKID